MADAPSPPFTVESTLNTDESSGTALRIFPKGVYAHSTPGEHELFILMPPRQHGDGRDRDGFLVMMPEGGIGRIPLETRNSKSNWTPPRERKSPGQIPFRDPFVQEFPVKSLGARNKRRHQAQILGNLVRIEDLYVGIYPDGELAPGRSPWPGDDEVQAVLRRERRATRPNTLAERARSANLDPLEYLERNVERYLTAQGYNLADGSAPSPIALAIAARARIEGADEPPEGAEALAAINDDWLDDADLAYLGRQDPARGHIAIGTQKAWNPRSKNWEYMLTGHISYDILDVVGRDLPYIHPYAPEGKNRRADAAFTLHDANDRRSHHLLSGHPVNPLLTPKPVMRFSFKAREWAMKPDEITEHRPRIITPFRLTTSNDLWHVLVDGVRTYLRTGELPNDAFVAKRRSYAPPSDTRASKPRPEGLKTYRGPVEDGAGYDVEPGLTLEDVIDETGLDQILSGQIAPRPINAPPVEMPKSAEPTPPVDAETTTDPAADDNDNFQSLEAYLREREAERAEAADLARADDPLENQKPEPPADETEETPEPTPPEPPIVTRPVIQKRIGPGGKANYGAARQEPPAPPAPNEYGYVPSLRILDALLAQRIEQMEHITRQPYDPDRIRRFARQTQTAVATLLEPADDALEAPPAQTIRDAMNRLALSASERTDGFGVHWRNTVETLRSLIAPLIR